MKLNTPAKRLALLLLALPAALPAVTVNFNSYSPIRYDSTQDAGTAAIFDSGTRFQLNGNAWKKIHFPYVVTRNTVLQFEFRGATTQGETHAIGFETDNLNSPNLMFQLWGTQTWGLQNYRNYATAPNWKTYSIPVGQFYVGPMKFLAFTNDHDVTGSTARGEFRNVQIVESAPTTIWHSDALVDSIGVGIHVWTGRGLGNSTIIKNLLNNAGVRHARDWFTYDQPNAYSSWRNINSGTGIKFCFSLTRGWGTVGSMKSNLVANVLDLAELIEGDNEPNGKSNANWPADTQAYSQALHSAWRGDTATADLPILAPSLAVNRADMVPSYTSLGDLKASLDYGNTHPYPGGSKPLSLLLSELSNVQIVSGNKPVIVTEVGYQNLLTSGTDGKLPLHQHNPASKAAIAKYLPRLYLEFLQRGVHRSYWFDLLDNYTDAQCAADNKLTDFEAHIGLVDYSFTPKPAYYALQNLITIMKDPGPAYAPTPIAVSVSGSADVKSMLFQRRDGKYRLAIWRDVKIYDTTMPHNGTSYDINIPSVPISVNFPGTTTVTIYRPTTSSAPAEPNKVGDPISVDVGGEVVILAF